MSSPTRGRSKSPTRKGRSNSPTRRSSQKSSPQKQRQDKLYALRKPGVYFDPKSSDPLSSRLVHRWMFAEFIGSLFTNLIAQGSVISSGQLTYQFKYDELTAGRMLCIAFATSFVSFFSFFFPPDYTLILKTSTKRKKTRKVPPSPSQSSLFCI